MLKALIAAISMLALELTLSPSAMAQDAEHAVRARKGVFQNFAWHFGPLVAMARGELAYDADRAARHAEMLEGLPRYLPELFVEGSSNAERNDTRALPVIWSDNDGFMTRFEALLTEIDALADVAGSGQSEMATQVAATGQACANCHDNFRAR